MPHQTPSHVIDLVLGPISRKVKFEDISLDEMEFILSDPDYFDFQIFKIINLLKMSHMSADAVQHQYLLQGPKITNATWQTTADASTLFRSKAAVT